MMKTNMSQEISYLVCLDEVSTEESSEGFHASMLGSPGYSDRVTCCEPYSQCAGGCGVMVVADPSSAQDVVVPSDQHSPRVSIALHLRTEQVDSVHCWREDTCQTNKD